MRILFAVSNENVSDAIVKSYHKNYNDTITFKNVFYFNAIIKEIQRDRTYDRIVVSEDLEPFANNNYDAIDKFIYERLEAISEEINDFADAKIPIILICTDRRTKSSSMIHKLYNIGIYDALIGSDRRIDNVCKLINVPRTKEEAMQYYKLENAGDSKSSLEDVSEEEVQNIVSYYKKLGKNEERYTDSFNNIASQYTDEQLKIIIRYLPINVKAVLEAECPKYQELVTYASDRDKIREQKEKERLQEQKLKEKEEYEERIKEQYEQKKKEQEKAEKEQRKESYIPNAETNNQRKQQQPIGIDLLDRKMNRPNIQGEVLIPNAINTKNARRVLSDDEMNIESARTIRPESINQTQNIQQPQMKEQNAPVQNVQNIQTQSENVQRQQIEQNQSQIQTTQEQSQRPAQNITNNQSIGQVNQVQEVKQQEKEEESVTLPGFEDLELPKEPIKEEVKQAEAINRPELNNAPIANNQGSMFAVMPKEETKAVQNVPNVQPMKQIQPVQEQPMASTEEVKEETLQEEPVKKGRGRPRKYPVDPNPKPKGKRGRPRKNPLPEEEPEKESKQLENPVVPTLPGFEDLDVEVPKAEETVVLPGFENENITEDFSSFDTFEKPEGKITQKPEEVQDNANNFVKQENTTNNNDESTTTLPGFEDEEFENIELPKDANGSTLDEDFMNFNSSADQKADVNVDNNINTNTVVPNQNNANNENVVNVSTPNNIESVSESNIQNAQNDTDEDVTLPGFDLESYITQDEENENNVEPVKRENVTLPGFDEEFNRDNQSTEIKEDSVLSSSNINNNINNNSNNNFNNSQSYEASEARAQETNTLPGFENNLSEELNSSTISTATSYRNNDFERKEGIRKLEEKRVFSTGTLESVLTRDKKIAAFIGTSKNGTSFIVNNLASLFSSIGVKTAILDMTKNRNAYYIYTNNDENLRQISYDAIDKLENGVAEGIKVDRNLDVYTAVPNEEKDFSNAEAILTTLARTYSLVLIDCDFDTPLGYFANAQEIYLVQSMDILTIQPLTAFLRELKTNGILDQEKLRVVVNKEIKVRGLTSKTIIGGMSFYNDPSMSYMTELFNKDKIKACTLPFEDSTYSKYLETLVNCNVSISGYSKNFMNSLKILGNMVYPLLSKQTYIKTGPDYTRSNFSDEMNNTLNQMRNKY